jgi:tRNA modification GTPase
MHHVDDTIAAIASPPGGALRGVVRISGPQVIACLKRCFRAAEDGDLSRIRHASVLPGTLQIAPPVGALQCDLYLWPNERSYTKQPSAELHTIGAPPLLEAALQTLCDAGARLAEPGEFTMRAFLAGRLDLTQAEAVLGVIDARNRGELRVALSQLAGGLAAPLNELRSQLLDLLAHLEAGLDFVEEDIEFIARGELRRQLDGAAELVSRIESQLSTRAERGGVPRVVLVGWPNVGKSSLFNALAGDSAAIVSHLAGTTRDYLSRAVIVDGVELLLIDTAGVETLDPRGDDVVAEAQKMMAGQNAQADLQLFCIDSTRPINAWEEAELEAPTPRPRLVVLTKTDARRAPTLGVSGIETSSRTRAGLGALRQALRRRIESLAGREYLAVAGTATRCRESLRLAAECLRRASGLARDALGEELVAAEIRSTLEELGKVVGAVHTDDILDRIFSRFCIGK